MNRRGFLRFLGLAPMGVAAAAMPALPQPARGGLVSSKSYVVGERGCEVVLPRLNYERMLKSGLMTANEARQFASITIHR